MLIDTHAHLNFSAYKDDAEEVIKKTLEKGVFMINVGSQYSTSVRAVEFAKKYETGVWAAVGIHPLHLERRNFNYKDDNELEEIEIKTNGEEFNYENYLVLAKNPKVVAIGEMGLDYHHFEEGDDVEELKTKQKEILLQGIKLANAVKKPIIIHCWDAYDDLLEILKNNELEKKGVIHSFVGGYKTAKKFIELGYKIGLNGVVTYGISYNRLIREIDLRDIVLETDCPYLTPVPKKGERNEPLNVRYVAEKIAEVKNIKLEEVEKITTQNAKKLFGI
ncbi:MAG TPA: TatD family hydrolase [Candidatus Moranbacteria bacterium]|nr:TatD family hydrolase [Candidatus Moranbacteria bacterium]